MNIESIDTKKNELLGRTEVRAVISFSGVTPSNVDVQAELAKKLGAEAPRVVLRQILTRYGGGQATVRALVYADEKAQVAVEPRVKEKK